MDERVLAERLIASDTSTPDGLRGAAGFVKGWLEARDIDVREHDYDGLPVLVAEVGAPEDTPGAPTIILHGHIDVVPAHAEQFAPRIEGDRLIGRGAYDMKGGLAAMMCAVRDAAEQERVRVRFVCVPDEESEDVETHAIDWLVREGLRGDFAITGEPTDLHIGVQAKGVLALRRRISGRRHGSTPWLGDNAILKAHDAFRRIETLPFSRESSDLFDRPSINLARIRAADAFNKVPDRCEMDVDIRYLPNQDPGAILARSARSRTSRSRSARRGSRRSSRATTRTCSRCARRRGRFAGVETLSVGPRTARPMRRTFLDQGIPASSSGRRAPANHGPDEWVSIASLTSYRLSLCDFIATLPERLANPGEAPPPELRAVEGGLG
jgi:succinyl-diaminopimelate desuccinylase